LNLYKHPLNEEALDAITKLSEVSAIKEKAKKKKQKNLKKAGKKIARSLTKGDQPVTNVYDKILQNEALGSEVFKKKEKKLKKQKNQRDAPEGALAF
jgi:hypothetical protein